MLEAWNCKLAGLKFAASPINYFQVPSRLNKKKSSSIDSKSVSLFAVGRGCGQAVDPFKYSVLRDIL